MSAHHAAHRATIIVTLLAIIAGLLSPPSRPATAQPAVAGLATVQAGFTLLMDQFYRPPDSAALLTAAWDGAVGALSRAGYREPLPPRPSFAGTRERGWQVFAAAFADLEASAPPGLTPRELAFAALRGMTDSLAERNTAFLTPAEYRSAIADFDTDPTGSGLGLMISARPPWIVADVARGGPADLAGVRPGDMVLTINDRDVTIGGRAQLERGLAGPVNSTVRLTLSRPGDGPVVAQVTRGAFRFPDLEARTLPGGIGYVRLRAFSSFLAEPGKRTVIDELDAALEAFEDAGVSAWVVDLRDNPGGFAYTANEIAGRFLTDAVTLVAADQRGNTGQQMTAGRPFRVQRPMAVLVNDMTASAAELFAAAMQENDRAVIVGARTAGLLAGSMLYPLPDGAGLAVAVASARTGKGRVALDDGGLVPDVEVTDARTPADYARGADPQLSAAGAALRGRPAPAPSPDGLPRAMSEAALRSLLAAYAPPAEAAPSTPFIPTPRLLGDLVFTSPNQRANALGPVEDAPAIARATAERRWLGSFTRFYGEVAGLGGPYLSVTIDLYAAPAGAYAAVTSNDAPRAQRPATLPVEFGDGAVAYRGAWTNAGGVSLQWRSDRAVVTVSSLSAPGQESFDPVVALARMVDRELALSPLPPYAP
ncbi:MAG: S41 family peptidase [Dehalococcoidia bacterium]